MLGVECCVLRVVGFRMSSFGARYNYLLALDRQALGIGSDFISQVFLKSFGRSQPSHKSIKLSSTITDIKNKYTDLCRN